MNSWYHAQSSARRWGGTPELYLPIHEFIDSSKQVVSDVLRGQFGNHVRIVVTKDSVCITDYERD